ncbi:hypothetical protein COJ86_07555 [Bacillus cereus]|nr:hypothetical protein COJ86_07555 [Bacillus cereus]
MTRNVCKLTSLLFVSGGFGGVEGGLLFINKAPIFCIYPALTDSKTLTSKFSWSKAVRWESGCP